MSAPQIYVKGIDLTDFIWENYERLIRKEAVVAENKETGYEIRVCMDPCVDGRVLFRVFRDGRLIQTEDAIGEAELFDTYKMLNLQYLFQLVVDEDGSWLDTPQDTGDDAGESEEGAGDEPDFDKLVEKCHQYIDLSDGQDDLRLVKDVITLREDDLYQATRDYLDILMEDELDDMEEKEREDLLSAVLEHTLIYLSVKHGISVWRPDIYETEKGEKYIDPYPYTQDS